MGYVGKKPADIIATAVDTTTGTFSGDLTVDTSTLKVDSTNNRVGVGIASPQRDLVVNSGSSSGYIQLVNTASGTTSSNGLEIKLDSGGAEADIINRENGRISFWTNNTERMRIDSSGNLLVGKTIADNTTVGVRIQTDGFASFARDGNFPLLLNRKNDSGVILDIRHDDTTVGSIQERFNNIQIGTGETNILFNNGSNEISPSSSSGGVRDNTTDLGANNRRWKNVWVGGGVYLGGTGSANRLDYYEEGDWTPAYGGASVAPTVTYNTQKGTYVRIGQFVHLQGRISTNTTSGGSGNLRIIGFPFPNINATNMQSVINIGYNNGWALDKFPVGGNISPNTSHVTLYTARSSDYRDGLGTSINAGDLTTGTGNNDIIFSLTYRTDA